MSTNWYFVEDEDTLHYDGIFLLKTAGGWVPQIKWHEKEGCSCGCPDGSHIYRNMEEFRWFLAESEGTIVDEYDRPYNLNDFIEKLEKINSDTSRKHPHEKDVWKIDGWYFVRGDWC